MYYPTTSAASKNVNIGRGPKMFLGSSADSWCQAIAWLQMVFGVVFAVFVSYMIHLMSESIDETTDPEEKEEIEAEIFDDWINFALWITTFFLGLMLTFANKQKNRWLLWIWIVIETGYALLCLYYLIFWILTPVKIFAKVVRVLVSTLFISAVLARAKEVGGNNGTLAVVYGDRNVCPKY